MMKRPAGLSSDSPASAGLVADDDGYVAWRGLPLALPPKEQAVLHLLVRAWPQVVSKDRFAEQAWGERTMSDESLARCIAQLRKAAPAGLGLGIQAVYGRGYRLILTPERPAQDEGVDAAGASPDPQLPRAQAAPQQVAALHYARQLMEQRTEFGLRRATQLLRELIAQAPRYSAARLALAECLAATLSSGFELQSAGLDEGLAQLALVQRSAPRLPRLYAEMAHLLDCVWRFDEAQQLHRQVLAGAPDDATAHYYRGWHALALGNAEAAVDALQTAYRLNPYALSVSTLLARALGSAGQLEAGMALAERAHRNEIDNLQAHSFFLAYQAHLAPRPALAQAARRIALGRSPWAFAASSLAYVLARCGDAEGASRMLDLMDGDRPGARVNGVATLMALGREDEAMQRALDATQRRAGPLPILVHAAETAALRSRPGFGELRALIYRT